MHLAHFEYLMHSNPHWPCGESHCLSTFTPRCQHSQFKLGFTTDPLLFGIFSRFISSGNCTTSYYHFNMKYSQLCMRRLFESLKGLKEHPASSHNSLSYANARAQHRPLRVWAWAGRLRSPLLCFNDYCGGFLSVYLQLPYQCFWNPHRRGKDEGVLNWRWLCARWIVKTGIKQTAHFFTVSEAAAIDLSQRRRQMPKRTYFAHFTKIYCVWTCYNSMMEIYNL